ncbi:MAG: NAD(P)(+) transhydrogenase (Re/Si-specific) subunit beta, partial [Planctomycetes bacterium]|nr:NAD(P)(+) transhydrogenase (Re/Si-specific) subunit beta [Planctomycetota bacterium]
MSAEFKDFLIHAAYLIGAGLFIFGIKRLSRVRTARRGNQLAAIGMLLAVLATLMTVENLNWVTVILGILVGSALGAWAAKRVEMTAMPELVALFNGLGGSASVFVALSY